MPDYSPKDIFYLISFNCNQRCSKCSHWKMPSEEDLVPISKLIVFLDFLGDFDQLCLVGGEPLLHKERILDILKNINPTVSTVIVTNGLLLTKEFLEKVAKYNVHFVLSIDTMDKEYWKYVRGSDSYDSVLSNLMVAKDILKPSQLSIQSVLAEQTKSHVNDVAMFAKKVGLYHSVQYYLDEGFDGHWTKLEQVNNSQKQLNIRCYSTGRNLSIMPNGDVYTCFQQSQIKGCESPLGNVQDSPVNEILSSEYTNFVLKCMKNCNLPCKTLKCNQKKD
nr:radical SAM protein [uncultured Methanolobus sp.]